MARPLGTSRGPHTGILADAHLTCDVSAARHVIRALGGAGGMVDAGTRAPLMAKMEPAREGTIGSGGHVSECGEPY